MTSERVSLHFIGNAFTRATGGTYDYKRAITLGLGSTVSNGPHTDFPVVISETQNDLKRGAMIKETIEKVISFQDLSEHDMAEVVEEIMEGTGRVRIIITIFGRATPVELEYWQVETV